MLALSLLADIVVPSFISEGTLPILRLINTPFNLQLEGFVQVKLILFGVVEVVSKIPVGLVGAVDVQLSVVTVVGVAVGVVVVVVGVAVGILGVVTLISVELLILGLFKSIKPFMAGWFGLLQAVSNAA